MAKGAGIEGAPAMNLMTLREREQATAAMVGAIERKIDRLAAAHAERLQALQKIRSALARATLAGQGAPENDSRRDN